MKKQSLKLRSLALVLAGLATVTWLMALVFAPASSA